MFPSHGSLYSAIILAALEGTRYLFFFYLVPSLRTSISVILCQISWQKGKTIQSRVWKEILCERIAE